MATDHYRSVRYILGHITDSTMCKSRRKLNKADESYLPLYAQTRLSK